MKDAVNLQVPTLSTREVEILRWTALGSNSSDIAQILHLSPETIRSNIKNICRKLNAKNKTHAVLLAIPLNLIDPKIHPNG